MSDLQQAWLATFAVTALLAVPFAVLSIISVKRGLRPERDETGEYRGRE